MQGPILVAEDGKDRAHYSCEFKSLSGHGSLSAFFSVILQFLKRYMPHDAPVSHRRNHIVCLKYSVPNLIVGRNRRNNLLPASSKWRWRLLGSEI